MVRRADTATARQISSGPLFYFLQNRTELEPRSGSAGISGFSKTKSEFFHVFSF